MCVSLDYLYHIRATESREGVRFLGLNYRLLCAIMWMLGIKEID